MKSAELTQKLERLTAWLTANELDGVALSRGDNFSWLGCGADNLVNYAGETGVATLVATPDGVTLVTNNIEADRLVTEELGRVELAGVESHSWHEPAGRGEIVARLTAGRRFAGDSALAGLPPLPDGFGALRYSLTDAEIARYRTLGRDVADGMENAARAVEPGMTEADIAGLIALEYRMRGIAPIVLLAAADERIRTWRHPLPKDVAVERCAMLVSCGRRGGLVAAITRLVHFGPLSDDLAVRHDAVCAVDAAMIAATRPGRKIAEVFADARQAYADSGFPDEWQLHHQGGAIGYLARDYIADPASVAVVQPNQAFAWNPSICGTKCEGTTLITPTGAEDLTASGDDWPVVTVQTAQGPLARAGMLVR
jgi:Xaa-Pro aminopeptidase